jgi:sugar phosphate isomerase/epimerase
VLSIGYDERMVRLKYAADVLSTVADRCRDLGVGLVLENMLPHHPFGSTSEMLWIMGAMASVNVCTCLDTGHAALSGDIYNVMFKLSGHLKIVHANDNLGRTDDHIAPGKGTIDWPRLLFELSETGFHGGFILELQGAPLDQMERVLDDARGARLFLRGIAKKLYLSGPPTVNVASKPLGGLGTREH